MTKPTKITENVSQFLDRAAAAYGKMKAENFSIEVFQDIQYFEMSSPIEQIFYAAFLAVVECQGHTLNAEPKELDEYGDELPAPGMHIMPQEQVGKYRVDFAVSNIPYVPGSWSFAPIAVELDGHEFHDRDKRQRSYEKARDRFLQQSGYKVLHFTGSDVVADPYKCVWEVLSMLGGNAMEEYDPDHPLGE